MTSYTHNKNALNQQWFAAEEEQESQHIARADEKLHHLDLGVARFTEFSMTFILTEWINADFYKSKLKELAVAWPILSTRMDRIRTKLMYSNSDRTSIMWSHKVVNSAIGTKLPEYAQDDLPLSIDISHLDEYFKFPAMTTITAPTRITKPAVFRLQVLQFMDASVLKFTVQHPLCDAKGLHRIVSAYCDLLAGKQIQALNPRTPLEMVNEDKLSEHSGDTGDSGEDVEPLMEPQESDSSQYFSKGWGKFLMSGVSQWSRKPLGDPRVSKAVLVPLPVMMHWRTVADGLGIRVSRNDLLMAWLYMCAIPKAGKAALKFTFVLNVEQFLNTTADLHNGWCLVPVNDIPEKVIGKIRSSPNQIETLIQLAKCFRDIIERARSPKFIEQTLKDHAATPVITPKDFGKSEPNIRISSWSYIDMFALKFATGPRPVTKAERVLTPRWIAGNIDFCPAFVWANLTCDDTIVTWNESRGYWIQGRLHQEVWERIAQSSAMVLLDQIPKKA